MERQIQLQADVGSLSLRGLGLFSDMLAALSADNVTPMAMLQMEQLGALFHVNGRFANRVPELLTRASSHPIGRLSLAAGWRRGDSVSLLAESAGGQAISLLSLCIANIYNREAVGEILSRLSSNLLPKSSPRAGLAHLADVAALVASKLNRFGFGNVLAEQTMRVHSAYKHMETKIPEGLLDLPTVEAMVDVFECLSHLRAEDTVIRVSGSCGILYLVSIIIFMFPLDATIAVESYVIHEGESGGRIMIEICNRAPVQAQMERKLSRSPILTLPIKVHVNRRKIEGACSFVWEGWLARKLQVEFATVGLTCTKRILVACCTVISQLATEMKLYKLTGINQHMKFEALLGLNPVERIDRICQDIFLETPGQGKLDAKIAWDRLYSILTPIVRGLKCLNSRQCTKCLGSFEEHLFHTYNTRSHCSLAYISGIIGQCLKVGLYCLLINAHGTISVPGTLPSAHEMRDIIFDTINGSPDAQGMHTQAILDDVMNLIYPSGSLGRSSGACTIFPTCLETIKVDTDQAFTFELHDGVFIFENRYHHSLLSDLTSRPLARKSLASDHSQIVPSSHGEHSSIQFTLREGYEKLILSTTVHALGRSSRLNLASVISGYMCLSRTRQCEHRLDSPLIFSRDSFPIDQVMVTSVINPKAWGAMSLVMTRSNPVAQFLSCEMTASCLLVKGTCLNCAIQQAELDFSVLIIS